MFHSQEHVRKVSQITLDFNTQAKGLINRPQRMNLFWTRHSANMYYYIKICLKLRKVEMYLTFYWKEEESSILKGLGPAFSPSGTSCCHHTSGLVIWPVSGQSSQQKLQGSVKEVTLVSVTRSLSSFHMLGLCFFIGLLCLARSGKSSIEWFPSLFKKHC